MYIKKINTDHVIKVRNIIIKNLHDLGVKLNSILQIKTNDIDFEKKTIFWYKSLRTHRLERNKQLIHIDINLENDLLWLINNNKCKEFDSYLFQSRTGFNKPITRSMCHKLLEKQGSRNKTMKKTINLSSCDSVDFSDLGEYNKIAILFAKIAIQRNIRFHLTKKEVCALAFGNCHYCNQKPNSYRIGIETPINGIDRVDSDLEYTLNNTVSCCGTCNTMKMSHLPEFFLSHIEKIYKFKYLDETTQTDVQYK